jgi:hypothetical protein
MHLGYFRTIDSDIFHNNRAKCDLAEHEFSARRAPIFGRSHRHYPSRRLCERRVRSRTSEHTSGLVTRGARAGVYVAQANGAADGIVFGFGTLANVQTGAVNVYGPSCGNLIATFTDPYGTMPGHAVSGYVNQNTPGGLIFDERDNLISIQTR